MIAIRHTGLYVDNIDYMEQFYKSVFGMFAVCSKEPDSNELLDELIGFNNVEIVTSKLITPYGKIQQQGDMIELVKVVSDIRSESVDSSLAVFATGMAHIAFGVDDMESVINKIVENGGSIYTRMFRMNNGNLCCFCRDPEGNWLELIQRN